MNYTIQIRRLIRIILEEMESPTNPINLSTGNPSLQYCLSLYKTSGKVHTDQEARKVLAIATGEGYLIIDNSEGKGAYQQKISITHKGLRLLKPLGYLNALADAANKLPPFIALIISVLALTVSFYTLLNKMR
jgi:hypothetical protein